MSEQQYHDQGGYLNPRSPACGNHNDNYAVWSSVLDQAKRGNHADALTTLQTLLDHIAETGEKKSCIHLLSEIKATLDHGDLPGCLNVRQRLNALMSDQQLAERQPAPRHRGTGRGLAASQEGATPEETLRSLWCQLYECLRHCCQTTGFGCFHITIERVHGNGQNIAVTLRGGTSYRFILSNAVVSALPLQHDGRCLCGSVLDDHLQARST
jgi:hypothetical protein